MRVCLLTLCVLQVLNHAYMRTTDWVTAADMELLALMMQVSFTSYVQLATAALPALKQSGGVSLSLSYTVC